jgi:hypothetical protein
LYFNFAGVLPGELPAKALAKCFWQREVEEELATLGLRGKWVLSKEPGPLSGSYDHAMEMVDKMRSCQLYLHNCSDHCKSKGIIKTKSVPSRGTSMCFNLIFLHFNFSV